MEEWIQNLNLTEEDLRREFAVLRHREVLGATKKRGKFLHIILETPHRVSDERKEL